MTEKELQLILDKTCDELSKRLSEEHIVTKDEFWELLFTKLEQD